MRRARSINPPPGDLGLEGIAFDTIPNLAQQGFGAMTIPPTGDHRARVDGKQFETFVADVLRSLGGELRDFRLEEQELVLADDGRYRIDITIRFTAVGVDFLVLVECKDHARPVEREDVQILADKKRTVGAHKGVLFSTNGFQRGAIEYAQKHGIALVRVLEGALTYETRGAGMARIPPPQWANIPLLVAQYIRESKPGTIRVTVLQPDTQADLVEFLTTR
jgi:restriction system protein